MDTETVDEPKTSPSIAAVCYADLVAACDRMFDAWDYQGDRLVGAVYHAKEALKAAADAARRHMTEDKRPGCYGLPPIGESPEKWLRELGAVRPMAVAADVVLVIGKWKHGYYPIRYWKGRVCLGPEELNGPPITRWQEDWHLFGVRCSPLSRDDVRRIVDHLADAVSA